MADSIPAGVLGAFPMGPIRAISTIDHGLIHATYKIEAERGTFVLQRLHPVLASVEVAEDFRHVTDFLRQRAFPAPLCVPTSAGPVLAHDESGRPWRLQT